MDKSGALKEAGVGMYVDCVKSNFGTSEFIPLEGRWVVERTFSWLSENKLPLPWSKIDRLSALKFY